MIFYIIVNSICCVSLWSDVSLRRVSSLASRATVQLLLLPRPRRAPPVSTHLIAPPSPRIRARALFVCALEAEDRRGAIDPACAGRVQSSEAWVRQSVVAPALSLSLPAHSNKRPQEDDVNESTADERTTRTNEEAEGGREGGRRGVCRELHRADPRQSQA